LIDRARRRLATRHGGGQERLDIDEVEIPAPVGDEELVAVHDALEIYRMGCWLLGRENPVNRPLRLIGLGVRGRVEVRERRLMLFAPLEGGSNPAGPGK